MKLILKAFAAPVTLLLSLFIRLCATLLSHAAFLFGIASTVLGLLAVIVLATISITNGLILLGIAALVSPIGIPDYSASIFR